MHIRIFTIVYGRHLEHLKRLATCLSWPKNRKALEGASWFVETNDPKRVQEILGPLGIPLEFSTLRGNYFGSLAAQAGVCASNGWCMFAANPDLVFGEGSIQTLRTIAEEQEGLCVAVPHPRVNETFPELNEATSNARLVKVAFEHLHPSWKVCSAHVKESGSYVGGVVWRRLGDLYGVTARLPSVFFARTLPGDEEALRAGGDGAWDHTWPAKLVREQRHRIIGSSDAAFCVEISRQSDPRTSQRRAVIDDYHKDLEHHRVNRNTVTIWRAE